MFKLDTITFTPDEGFSGYPTAYDDTNMNNTTVIVDISMDELSNGNNYQVVQHSKDFEYIGYQDCRDLFAAITIANMVELGQINLKD